MDDESRAKVAANHATVPTKEALSLGLVGKTPEDLAIITRGAIGAGNVIGTGEDVRGGAPTVTCVAAVVVG